MDIRTIKSKPAFLAVVGLVVAGVGVGIGHLLPRDTATPQVFQGTVSAVGINGDEFGVSLDGRQPGKSFGLGAVPWKDTDGTWRDSSPVDCLKPLSQGQQIRFGVVHVNDPGFSTDLVAWVDCSNATG
ncbi:hypothetical protein D7Y56_00005 (plasmid) [Streptomyces sp. S501]|uniref:hypothetical protein n=1 Tax=Streptomyces sp. S501 TaxID=2420135 RepID=UPI00106E601C|nr:hypothetical protein [Streptomyces sp. S501]QBR04492.1 hypothetical protein D7Y56_00005 [Streptomyces sp. S501]